MELFQQVNLWLPALLWPGCLLGCLSALTSSELKMELATPTGRRETFPGHGCPLWASLGRRVWGRAGRAECSSCSAFLWFHLRLLDLCPLEFLLNTLKIVRVFFLNFQPLPNVTSGENGSWTPRNLKLAGLIQGTFLKGVT